MSKKRSSGPDTSDLPAKKASVSEEVDFLWEEHCFLCGERANPKKSKPLTSVSPTFSREKCLRGLRLKSDETVFTRLEKATDLVQIKAKYHKQCYSKILVDLRIAETRPQSKENEIKRISTHDSVAQSVLDEYVNQLRAGKVLLLPELCENYREKLLKNGYDELDIDNVRVSFIKSHLKNVCKDEFIFYSKKGKPDILFSADFEKNDINDIKYDYLSNLLASQKTSDLENDTCRVDADVYPDFSNNQILHRAACILRGHIDDIPPSSDFYPTPPETSQDKSDEYIPELLKNFIIWLLDKGACDRADVELSGTIKRRSTAICESIIYASSTTQHYMVPPLHHGLTVQLHHDYGSRSLIEMLNSFGFCASYHELRLFLTSAAVTEIERSKGVYVPSNIIPRSEGGAVIQEADDNLDLTVDTVDGRNTYHSMGRALFQRQSFHSRRDFERIPRIQKTTLDFKTLGAQFELLPFTKPKQRSEPPRIEGVVTILKTELERKLETNKRDLLWVFGRRHTRLILPEISNKEQIFPSWKLFSSLFCEKVETKTVASTLPAINARPSDMSTVYTTLMRGKETAAACGQNYHIHTQDQQLYAIFQMVTFAFPELFDGARNRLGGFHTCVVFVDCINKIWGDTLYDMLVESGVYAANTASHMLKGKEFHRAVRGLTLCYEVLLTLLIDNFLIWLEKTGNTQVLEGIEATITNFCHDFENEKMSKDTLTGYCDALNDAVAGLLSQFRSEKSSSSPNFRFWDSCVDSLHLMLSFIRAEREFNWDLHVMCATHMLPYFFACDKPNYSRWGTLYVSEMTCSLPEEIKQEFKCGHFVVNFTEGVFNGIWSDMGMEMSTVKDSKGDGGIVGMTRKENALLRWSITRNLTGSYSSAIRKRSGKCACDVSKTDEVKVSKQDEAHVRKILEYAKNHMTDPFSDETRSDKLINISSGLVAPDEVSASLLNALSTGEVKLFKFLESTLEKNSSNQKSFYDRITQYNLKNFSSVHDKKVKPRGKTSTETISPELLYQRALAISNMCGGISLEAILSRPLSTHPPILFKPDGSRRTNTKSDLLHVLEKEVGQYILKEKPQGTHIIVIIDGIALLQSLNTVALRTFDDVAMKVMEHLLNHLIYSTEVHLIFDRYDTVDIHPKQDERARRYGTENRVYDIKGGRPLPDFKKVLANNASKSALNAFICEYLGANLSKSPILTRESEKKVIVAGGFKPRDDAFVISNSPITSKPDLRCNHIEADTRIIFHTSVVASSLAKNDINAHIFLESPDTDVLLLSVAHYHTLTVAPLLWFVTGKVDRLVDKRRFIPVHILAKKIGKDMSRALLPIHAMTGCDTVSSISGFGKKTVYKALKNMSKEMIKSLSSITDQPFEAALVSTTVFMAQLFDPKRKSKACRSSINSLRFHLALEKNLPITRLPPCESVLTQHLKRSLWQTREWIGAISPKIGNTDPLECGWKADDDKLVPVYYEGDSAMELLDTYICSCRGALCCETDKCPCIISGLACSSLCNCSSNCRNQEEIHLEMISEEADSDEEMIRDSHENQSPE